MGRFEKYRAYREQINNEWEVKTALNNVSSEVNAYREKINAISPKILIHYTPINIKIFDLLTIDVSKKSNVNEIQSFINEFNSSELATMQEQAELLLMRSKSDHPSEFEEWWLDQDTGASVINRCNLMFNNAQNQNMTFDKSSYDDLLKFKAIIKMAKTNQNRFNNLNAQNDSKIPKSHSLYKFYLTVIYGVIVLALAALVLIIVAIVLT